MFKHVILFVLLSFGTSSLHSSGELPEITDIHVDPTVIFKTNDPSISMKTAAWFLASHWRKPTEADLYAPLGRLQATSTVETFKDGRKIPLIFSDLLAGKDPQELHDTAIQHLDSLETTKDTALGAFSKEIVAVFCNPKQLTSLHVPIKEHIAILRQLRRQGYRIHLTGNYAYPKELRAQYEPLFKKCFHGCRLSGDTGHVKPAREFFEGVDRKTTIFIETELHHIPAELTLRGFAIPPQNGVAALVHGLKRNGITLEE